MTSAKAIQMMHSTPRCGARCRSGKPCAGPAVVGKSRCRMHGGAEGSGAPYGNRNALKHGFFTKEALEERREIRRRYRELKELMAKHSYA